MGTGLDVCTNLKIKTNTRKTGANKIIHIFCEKKKKSKNEAFDF